MNREIDILWVLVASALVFFMQAGFLTLEIGLTRSKNNINVALKNLIDFAIVTLVYWAFGFAIMFGRSAAGLIGTSGFFLDLAAAPMDLLAFLLFQIMFCGTSVTMIAGATAERMRFRGFAWIVLFVSGIIYPIYGHWAWNGNDIGVPNGWLGSSGFVDLAGSTVVHSIGGWVSLAILLIIGPRAGRFEADGTPRRIGGSNLALSALGVFILWFGWIGFNGGSMFAFNDRAIQVIINTMLAGSAGLVTALVATDLMRGRPQVEAGMNGALAGLVAISAGAHVMSGLWAVVIGLVGALVMLAVEQQLERWHIDDAVGVVPVHLGAGIWGTLAVGFFGDPALLGTGLDRLGQIGVQAFGIVTAGLWALPLTYLVFSAVHRVYSLRVSPESEQVGLNVSEHNSGNEFLDLVTVMGEQERSGDLSLRAPVEPFTEIGIVASRYNRLVERLEVETALNRAILDSASDGIISFTRGTLTITSVNPAATRMFGCRAAEMLHRPLTDYLGIPEVEGVPLNAHTLDEVFAYKLAAEGGRVELVAQRADGTSFPIELTLGEATLPSEAFFTAIIRDLSV